MWEQVRQAMSQSTTRVLSQFASLLPGIVALLLVMIVSVAVAGLLAGILRRVRRWAHFGERGGPRGFFLFSDWAPGKNPTFLVGGGCPGVGV